MAELADEELESLRSAAARTQELDGELGRLRDAGQEGDRRYRQLEAQQQQLVGQVQAYLSQQQQRPQPVQQQVYSDDDPIVERRQWNQEFERGVERKINPVFENLVNTYGQREQMHAQRAREQARYLVGLKSDLAPFVEKYSDEIEQMVSGMPLDQQGSVKTYENAVKAVKALHVDEVADERANARVRKILADMGVSADGDDDEDDDDELTQEELVERQVQRRLRDILGDSAPAVQAGRAAPRASAPMPQSTRAGGSAAKQRRRKIVPLDRTERYYAGIQGLTDEEYRDYGQDLTHDVFGFRDKKTGQIRARV